MMRETTLELKKTIKLLEQHTYQKKNKTYTIQEALISAKERHTIKEEPIQRKEKFGARPKIRTMGKRPCRFCGAPNWGHLYTNVQQKKQIATNAEVKDTTQSYVEKNIPTTEQ